MNEEGDSMGEGGGKSLVRLLLVRNVRDSRPAFLSFLNPPSFQATIAQQTHFLIYLLFLFDHVTAASVKDLFVRGGTRNEI